MDDEQILDLYFARDEQALAETDRKYGGYCYSLANGILNSEQDAEETVSDTYLKAWNTIPPHRPGVFKLFLAKITRNLAFSRWRQNTAGKRGGGEMQLVLDELADCICAPVGVEEQYDAKELSRASRIGVPASGNCSKVCSWMVIRFKVCLDALGLERTVEM